MADTEHHPDFKAFAALQNEPAKGSLDPNPNAERAERDEAGKREIASISEYQDPRDKLDQERHRLFAEARARAAATGHHGGTGRRKSASKK